MCVCVCVYVRACVRMSDYIIFGIWECIYAHYVHVFICVYVYMCICVYVYMCICVYCMCICVYIMQVYYVCIYIYIYIYIHECTYRADGFATLLHSENFMYVVAPTVAVHYFFLRK